MRVANIVVLGILLTVASALPSLELEKQIYAHLHGRNVDVTPFQLNNGSFVQRLDHFNLQDTRTWEQVRNF